MVCSDCIGGHSDCDSDGLSGTELLSSDLLAYRLSVNVAYTKTWKRKSILKLRFITHDAAHCWNKHANWWVSFSPLAVGLYLTPCWATVSIVTLALYVGFPVSRTKMTLTPVLIQRTAFIEWNLLFYPVCLHVIAETHSCWIFIQLIGLQWLGRCNLHVYATHDSYSFEV